MAQNEPNEETVLLRNLNTINVQGKEPKDENFLDVLVLTFCPSFKFKSWIFIASVVQVTLYATCLSVGGISDDAFLAVPTETLKDFGAKVRFFNALICASIPTLSVTTTPSTDLCARFSCMQTFCIFLATSSVSSSLVS